MLTLRRSLSPDCTPLKQRYDACFNLWFEGYLQPALDAASLRERGAMPHVSTDAVLDPSPPTPAAPAPPSTSTPSTTSTTSTTASSSAPSSSSSTAAAAADPQQSQSVWRRTSCLVTSWAGASVFRRRPAAPASHAVSADDMVSAPHVHVDEGELEPLDTTGMSPSQIKAAEYERACGRVWKEYQGCLKVS